MAEVGAAGNIFKQKVGGVPVWAIMGALGVGAVGVVWYTNRNSKTAAAQAAASGTNPSNVGNASSLYPVAPVTYVTGIPSGSTGSSTTPASTKTVTLRNKQTSGYHAGWDNAEPGLPYYADQGGHPASQWAGESATLPFGSSWSPGPAGVVGTQTQLLGPGGSTIWVNTEDVSGFGGGMGGFASPWQQMSQRYHVPHFWAGMGGGSKAAVATAARHTGHPIERLIALNPRRKAGLVRVG